MQAMENFKLDAFTTAIEELVRADETERALWLCDNLPAYYRDNKPLEILNLKNEILRRIATPTFYAESDIDAIMDPTDIKQAKSMLRAIMVIDDVKALNNKGFKPNVIDMGPGQYWLPFVLKNAGCNFTYKAIYLCQKAHNNAMELIPEVFGEPKIEQPSIFVACEVIEHLWHEADLKIEMLKRWTYCDIVHISTPLYTFEFNCQDWRKDIGHLRAYTPQEFTQTVNKIFPEYHPMFIQSQIMHMKLTFKETRFPEVMDRRNAFPEELKDQAT